MKNEKTEKLATEILKNCILLRDIMRGGKIKTYPMIYYDIESISNLEKKNIILNKILNNIPLSKEECNDKTVFELLPDKQENLMIRF